MEVARLEPIEHQVDRGDMRLRLAALGAFLIVPAQPTASAQPSHGRSTTHRRVRTPKWWLLGLRFTTGQQPTTCDPSPRYQSASVAIIGPYRLEPEEAPQQFGQY